jgi:hypothetical protein
MADPIENFNLVKGVNLDDSNFTVEEIQTAQEIIRQYVSDRYPDVDFSQLSTLNDILIRPFAQIYLVLGRLIKEFSKTNTIYGALSLPDSAKDNIIDSLLSNFSIQRRTGNVATGSVKINFFDNPNNYLIDESFQFSTTDGLIFSPSGTFTASSNPTNSSQLKIYKDVGSNNNFIIVPFIAELPGSEYNIEKYTSLNLISSRTGIISANAFTKFTGGQNKETNEELVNRLIPSLSARNLASPLAIEQTLRDKFPEIQQISIHGINSELMTRNSHNIFGIKSGAYCDIYVKTSSFVEEFFEQNLIAQKITPFLVSLDSRLAGYEGKYILSTTKDQLPGNYRITRVLSKELELTTLSSFNILKIFRKFDNTRNGNIIDNNLFTIQEATYSSYSTQDIIFDADSYGIADTISVNVFAEMIPSIKRIQDYVNQPGAQSALIDTIVKACIPCFITTSEIVVRAKIGTTNADTIQSNIINYINTINPQKQNIRVDGIILSILSNSNVISVDTPIMIQASILAPDIDFTKIDTFSESILEIQENLSLGYSKDNIAFFSRKSGIPVTLIEV